jgi:S1-C subfamily serine protease
VAVAVVGVLVLAAAGFGLSRVFGTSDSPAQTNSVNANQAGGPIQWLGMQIEGLPPATVVIATVAPGSPAEVAGLEPGDVLDAINGRAINTTSDIGAAIKGLNAGDGVDIQVNRGSTQLTTRAMLAAPPSHP